ncbi:hypothetical protein ACP275_08G118400 [Erythranthe tilingii]
MDNGGVSPSLMQGGGLGIIVGFGGGIGSGLGSDKYFGGDDDGGGTDGGASVGPSGANKAGDGVMVAHLGCLYGFSQKVPKTIYHHYDTQYIYRGNMLRAP